MSDSRLVRRITEMLNNAHRDPGVIDNIDVAHKMIRELGLKQESCVRYNYAPRFGNRGLDVCHDCGEPVIHNQESAARMLEKLDGRDRRFKPELVTRYTTEWETSYRQPRSAEKLGLTGDGE